MRGAPRVAGAILLLLAPVLVCREAMAAGSKPDPAAPRECNLQQYQIHLTQLQALVDRCAHAPSAASCDARDVGPDDMVAISSAKRLVSYAWLRSVLADAPSVKGAEAQAASARDLAAASTRLQGDQQSSRFLDLADTANTAPKKAAMAEESAAVSQAAARKVLTAILAGNEFHHETPPNLLQKGLASLRNWIVDRLLSVAAFSSEARWITRAMFAVIFLVASAGLWLWIAWRKKRQRLGLLSFSSLAGNEPTEEKEWERWSREGRHFAEAGRWREAIHSLYWAAIAALGARGMWPEDRARTPREYLAVLRPGNAHRADLDAFTRSFEGIWYGHQPADKSAYEKALVWLERLAAR